MSTERVCLPARVRYVRLVDGGEEALDAFLASVRDRGRFEGLREGRAVERAELAELVGRAVAAVEEDRTRAADELARSAVRLGAAIASVLVRREIDAGSYDLEAIVRETLSHGPADRGNCVVHLNPADHARLAAVPFRAGTVLRPDEDVAPGDVHVETSVGLLVRETRTALAEIERRLLEDLP